MRKIDRLRRGVGAALLSLALVASGTVALGAEENGDRSAVPDAQSGEEGAGSPAGPAEADLNEGDAGSADSGAEDPGGLDPEGLDLDAVGPVEGTGPDPADPPEFDATFTDLIIRAVAEDPTLNAVDLGDVVGLPAEGPMSIIHEGGLLSVSVNFESDPSATQVNAIGAVAEVHRVLQVVPTVLAYVAPTSLYRLLDVDGVASVEVNLSPETDVQERDLTPQEKEALVQRIVESGGQTGGPVASGFASDCRAIPAAANPALNVDKAWSKWGVDGTGVTIGILSTTYDTAPGIYTSAAQDIRDGLLPGPGNPCGYTQRVRILNEDAPASLLNDEARAMAQIIHGIAPGADIVVAGLGDSRAATAQSVKDLANAGVDIIVDDISWSGEPSFQKGIIAQQVDLAKQKGILYFASAGNGNSVQETGGFGSGVGYPVPGHQSNRYVPTACPEWVLAPAGATTFDCMDFSPDGSGTPYGLFLGTPTYEGGVARPSSLAYVLNWSEPKNAVKTNLQLQLYGFDMSGETPQVCLGGSSAATAVTEPYRYASWSSSSACRLTSQKDKNYFALVVVRKTSTPGYGTPMVRATSFSSGAASASWREFHKTEGNNVIQSSLVGHHGDGSSFAVAAAPWDDPLVVESYSSLGGNEQWFGPAVGTSVAKPLAQRVTPAAPRIMGLDGIPNSFFGSYLDTVNGKNVYGFYGTSASAPTVAAVAALGLQKTPTMVSVQVEQLLEASANSAIRNPYAIAGTPGDRVYGAGLVDAAAFLDIVPDVVLDFSGIPAPRLDGSPYVGKTLTVRGASAADFVPEATSVSYQWMRNGVAISGATGASYMLKAMDLDQRISARVTGTRLGYTDGVATTAGVKVVPQPPNDPSVDRMWGSDRYATNLHVNQKVGVKSGPVFIATGSNFADALSIGPVVSIEGGSLFLVPRGSVNQATLNRIKALSPSGVYIVGGTGAVSEATARQVGAAVGRTPVRVSGADRYATSEAIYKRFFVNPGRAVDRAFVATGTNYPDALSAAAAGGALKAPVILVNGVSGRNVSPYIQESLRTKKVSEVLIAGGKGAVNATIEKNLSAKFSVRRLSGANRYDTNAAVNAYLTSKSPSVDLAQVWLATGNGFPDALSAAVPAGNPARRLVLSNGKCIPKPVVTDWITKPGSTVTDVVLVGGTGVLGQSVMALTQCK